MGCPQPRHQPATLIWQHVILHDRTRNRGRFVGRIVDDADELRGHGSGHAPSDCPAFRPAMLIGGRAYGPQPWRLTEAAGDNLRSTVDHTGALRSSTSPSGLGLDCHRIDSEQWQLSDSSLE